MKAWRIFEDGNAWDKFELVDMPKPTHKDMAGTTMDVGVMRKAEEGEELWQDYVIMKVLAAGLSTPDITMATTAYPVPVPKPYVSGQEAVGIVEDASPHLKHLLGKRVVGYTPQPFGSFAEYCIATPALLFECPEEFSDEEGAAYLIAAHTAYHAVHRRGQVETEETVLVLGSAGGVPSAAVQLCVAAGCHVIAVAGGKEKMAFCKALGAHTLIDHQAEDFVEAVRRETEGRGVNGIVDFVQGEAGQRARTLMAVEGRHIMAGHAGGLLPVDPHEFYLQNYTLVGVNVGVGYGTERHHRMEEETDAYLKDLISKGLYEPKLSKVVSFEGIPEALKEVSGRQVCGRIVARIGSR
jgi:NADPH2:quinone reductase